MFGSDQSGRVLQVQGSGRDQALGDQGFGDQGAPRERRVDLQGAELRHETGHGDCAEIAVGLQIAGRNADDPRVAGQIDGIGDDGRGSIGLGGSASQYADGVGDAK